MAATNSQQQTSLPEAHRKSPPLGEKLVEVFVHVFVAAVIFAPLRALGNDSWSEAQKSLFAALIAASLSVFAGFLFPKWARQIIQAGWEEMLQRPEMLAIKDMILNLASIDSGANELKGLIGEAKESVGEARKALTAEATRTGCALDLLVSPSGVTLLRAIRGRIGSSGDQIVGSYLTDQARLLGSGGFLFTMEGYLEYLENILLEDKSSLICLNKTLPIGWLAPISGDEGFIYEYARIARAKRESIKRLTMVADHELFHSQYEHALSELPTTPTEANMELVYRWFICLLLHVLFAGAGKGTPEVEAVLQSLGEFGEKVRQRALGIYSDGTATPTRRFVQESRLIHPKSIETVWKYVDSTRSNQQLKERWSELVNSTFFGLMGADGSLWALRSTVAGIVTNDELRRAVDEHSEVGVFRMASGKVLAFHSKGDLFAGVVLRLFERPEMIEQELLQLFGRCTEDGQCGDAFGMIGGSQCQM